MATTQEMQKKVDEANKASLAASKVLGTTYKAGTIATFFPGYKEPTPTPTPDPQASTYTAPKQTGVDWNSLYNTYSQKANQQNWSWFWIGSNTNTANRRYYRKENNQWIQKGSESEAQQYYTAPKPTPTPTPTTQIPFTSADRYNPNTGQINPGYIEPATNKYNQNTGQLNPSYVEPTTTPPQHQLLLQLQLLQHLKHKLLYIKEFQFLII